MHTEAGGYQQERNLISQKEGNMTINKASRAHATRRICMGRDKIEGNGRERKEEYDETGSATQKPKAP